MKQVVGGGFTGLHDDGPDGIREAEIVNSLVEASRRCAYDPLRTEAYQEERVRVESVGIVEKLRLLMGERVRRYFDAIAAKLFSIPLTHDNLSNHCQIFCANLLNFKLFGSFIATSPN